ncbi:lipase family protein, partial [Pseudomonas sp. SDO528_S397]
ARPDAYRKAHEKAYDALRAEVGKVQTARERLLTLRSTTARETDVYGNASPTPQDLAHWKAHALNTTEEPLATAPPELVDNDQAIAAIIGGHVVGAPHDVDIDSIG